MTDTRNKVDKLNLLRFMAFMMIFLLHSTVYMPEGWDQMPNSWLIYTPAWAGTWIFFILAGYGVGASLYSGKYDPMWDRDMPLGKRGIIRFYARRLSVIVPMYWLWILCVSIFVQSDILRPGPTHIKMLLKLFLFDYHEEFYQETFGVAWYLTTLVRLYILAPIIYLLMSRLIKTKRPTVLAVFTIIGLFLGLRIAMWYHYRISPPDMWSVEVYKPFWFNLDFFACGMMVNWLRKGNNKGAADQRNNEHMLYQVCGYASGSLILGLSVVSAYYYYQADRVLRETTVFMDIYRYVLPSIYLLLSLIFIYCFDIRRTYEYKQLSMKQIVKNPSRIFDCFRFIQYPMYLFHTTVMYCLSEVYVSGMYDGSLRLLGVHADMIIWASGILFIIYAFGLTVLLSSILAFYVTTSRHF